MKENWSHFNSSPMAFLLVAIVMLLFAGCMKSYQPVTNWERTEYKNSQKDIYPNDIRENPNNFKTTQVAWTGIIEQAEIYENPENIEVVLLLEHHYYNWELNPDKSGIKYHLSSQGEGWFQTNWYLKKDTDMSYIEENFKPGHLAFVYGTPDSVLQNEDVLLNCTYIRTVPEEDYDADFYDYMPEGRKASSLDTTTTN